MSSSVICKCLAIWDKKTMWANYTEVTSSGLGGSLGTKHGLGLWEGPLADTHFHIPRLMAQKRLCKIPMIYA